jgi:hypothetical protein
MTDMQWFIVGFAAGIPVGVLLLWWIYEHHDNHDARHRR